MTTLTRITYIFLFILLLAHPHFITGHIFSIPKAYAQSLVNLTIFGVAYGIYWLHRKEIKTKEKEIEISYNKIDDAFKYIGVANSRLPLLKELTTNLLRRNAFNKKDKKTIFNDLLATATNSIAKADWGMFRFIDTKSGNTVKDFVYTNRQYVLLKVRISNQQILKGKINKIQSNSDLNIIPTSDKNSPVRCFIVFPKGKKYLNDDLSVLQSIVDQSQLFYKYLY